MPGPVRSGTIRDTGERGGFAVLVLTEADLQRVLPMADAIGAVEAALRERAAGTARSLLRTGIPVRGGRLVFTPGGFERLGVAGLRVYAAGYPGDTQLTAVWDAATGKLSGLILGGLLGAIRTGAIGGVAFKLLAPEAVRTVGVIGAGTQARTQLLALCAVRRPQRVRVFRRDPQRRREAAAALAAELGIPVDPAPSAEAAVRDAEVVITATPSATPVVAAAWVRRGTHVSSLGPKYRSRTELDPALVDRADLLASDFPEQYRAEPEFLLHGTPHLDRLADLAQLLTAPPLRDPAAITVFLSHGLAGTEVAVAAAALENARRLGLGTRLPMEPLPPNPG